LSFIPQTSKLLSAGTDKTLVIWDVIDKSRIGENLQHNGTIWSISSGRNIVATGCGDGFVRTLSFPDLKVSQTFTGHIGDVYSVDVGYDTTHM
jgi:WD40 repeat protein